jgi:hypothetical protein
MPGHFPFISFRLGRIVFQPMEKLPHTSSDTQRAIRIGIFKD